MNEINESERKLIQIYRMLQEHILNKGASYIKTLPKKIMIEKRTHS